jgi:PAS domain S-box-containing protein
MLGLSGAATKPGSVLALGDQAAIEQRDLLQVTLDSLQAHVAVLGEQGEIIITNRAWSRFAQDTSTAAGHGENYLALCDGATDEFSQRTAAGLRAILAGEQSEFSMEYHCDGPNGERWFVLRATLCRSPGNARIVLVRNDVTTRREAQTEVATQATLLDEIDVSVVAQIAARRALLAARNYLKAVTDSMGEGMFTLDTEGRVTYMNETGEKLLGWPLAELKGCLMHELAHSRRPDGSQLPGEECPILQARRGHVVRVEDDVFIRRDGRQLPVAYTAAPFETEDGVEGCVVVFQDISERKARETSLQDEVEKLAWIDRVRSALAEQRFVLYAQPIIDLRSREVVQRELLLRVREPDGSIVGPGDYLDIAERYGLIGEIDRWVIQRGAETAASGRPVQINVSARSISDWAILDHIERCIEQTAADPKLLVFEITETALVRDETAARVFAERLHDLGCKLALDDFGTGYGGFTYLKQLPVDFLKIDIEFVADLARNSASRHVVEAVVALARAFSLQTIAEGVEDSEALELLQELGVDFAQGYHIAQPEDLVREDLEREAYERRSTIGAAAHQPRAPRAESLIGRGP